MENSVEVPQKVKNYHVVHQTITRSPSKVNESNTLKGLLHIRVQHSITQLPRKGNNLVPGQLGNELRKCDVYAQCNTIWIF